MDIHGILTCLGKVIIYILTTTILQVNLQCLKFVFVRGISKILGGLGMKMTILQIVNIAKSVALKDAL